MSSTEFCPTLTTFSEQYRLVSNAEVVTIADSMAQMCYEMWDALARRFGPHFLGMVEGLHYEFQPVKSIPSGTVAVPKNGHNDPNALLIQK